MASEAPALRAAVLGDDSMGATLAHVMAGNGHHAALWCRTAEAVRAIKAGRRHPARPRWELHPNVAPTTSLDEALSGVALVVVAVPSGRFRETARAVAPLLVDGQALLSATKGIEAESLACMTQVLAEETGRARVGAVTGPNITPEIMAGQLSGVVVASHSAAVRGLAVRALATARLCVGVTGDLYGAELAAVLKNVAAVAAGMAAGRELGFNARGMVLARGMAEIERLGVALGASPAAFRGQACTADLFLTASSPQSLNRALGVELGRGRALAEIVAELPEVPEGIGAVRACRLLARRAGLSLPLCEAAAAVLEGERGADVLEKTLCETWNGEME